MKSYLVPGLGIVALLILGAAGFWFSAQAPSQEAPDIPLPDLSASSSLPALQDTAPSAGAPGGGTPVITQSQWKTFTPTDWAIILEWGSSWDQQFITDASGSLAQLSLGSKVATYFISRNVPIAEPSKLSYATTKRTVAGTSVSVHYYQNPREGYAAYEYFALPVGGDTYYFQIKETTVPLKEAEDFISFVKVK